MVARADGLRVASPLRMLFGLAEQFNQHRFGRAAEDAWQLGLITPDTAGEYLAAIRRSGRTGVIRLEAWLEKMSFVKQPHTAGLELDFVEMIERVGLPTPVRQHPLRLANGEDIHLDLAWPAARLAIEPGTRGGTPTWPKTRHGTGRALSSDGRSSATTSRPGRTSGAPRSRSWRSIDVEWPTSAVPCRVRSLSRNQVRQNRHQARAAVMRLVKCWRPSGRRWMPSP